MTATTAKKTVPRGTSNGKTPANPALELFQLPLDQVEVGANVRAGVGDLAELTESIRQHGVLEPIRVVQTGPLAYLVSWGQRRVLAARAAGLTHIPAVVAFEAPSGAQRTVQQLVENIQRRDLNPLEEARALRGILDAEPGLTQDALADRVGRARPTVTNLLRLLKVPESLQTAVAEGTLSATHIKAIAALPPKEAEALGKRAAAKKLSAHELEVEVQTAQAAATAADRERDAVKAVLPVIEKLLAKKKLAKADVTLYVTTEALREPLSAAGWTVIDRPKRVEYLYGGQKDACRVYEVNWHTPWGTNYPPEISQRCVDASHTKARLTATERERQQQNQKWERERQKQAEAEREAGKKRRGEVAGYAAIIAGDPARMERIDLFGTVTGQDHLVANWIREELLDNASRIVDPDDLWAKIEQLDETQVDAWRARIIANWLMSLPEDHPHRVRFLGVAEPPAKPKRGKKAATS